MTSKDNLYVGMGHVGLTSKVGTQMQAKAWGEGVLMEK